ncbi:hypothetical protein [Rubrivirga marina]|uniref:Uncharacterized protein n=1 Tax=Rubrivirga marina TaxID=1196024 RepID=A0A271IX78_9BACT|nr:hypothetical protein [Rubrivirga marina]PAP75424.1 hypothetical protein BSZ37_02675 [Rubrivirga marina]
MRRLSSSLVLAALVAVSGCGFLGGGSEAVGLTGTWEGVVYDATTQGATRYPITFRLRDTGVAITGDGEIEDLAQGTFEFLVVDGSFTEDLNVRLTLRFSEAPFEGQLSGRLVNRDPGTIEGSFSGRGELGNGAVRIEITSRST